MLNKKRIAIIIIIVVVLVLITVVMLASDNFLGLQSEDKQVVDSTQDSLVKNIETLPVSDEDLIKQAVIVSSTENSLNIVVRNFSERFGSYSTDSGYKNIEEVQVLATAKLQQELEKIMAKPLNTNDFYGISAKFIKANIENLDEELGEATVMVTLQMSETSVSQNSDVYYQDLLLSLIRSGNDWLVDTLEWQ